MTVIFEIKLLFINFDQLLASKLTCLSHLNKLHQASFELTVFVNYIYFRCFFERILQSYLNSNHINGCHAYTG